MFRSEAVLDQPMPLQPITPICNRSFLSARDMRTGGTSPKAMPASAELRMKSLRRITIPILCTHAE